MSSGQSKLDFNQMNVSSIVQTSIGFEKHIRKFSLPLVENKALLLVTAWLESLNGWELKNLSNS